MFKSNKGFTLIEMLIVVAIIGVLAGVVLVGLDPARRQGRDSRRISDLKQVQTALELYYNKFGIYPGDATGGKVLPGGSATWGNLETVLAAAVGITSLPDDPQKTATYYYGVDTSEYSKYVIGAKMEDTKNPALDNDLDGTVFSTDCADPVYCVQF